MLEESGRNAAFKLVEHCLPQIASSAASLNSALNSWDSLLRLDDSQLQFNWPGCIEVEKAVIAQGISLEGEESTRSHLGTLSMFGRRQGHKQRRISWRFGLLLLQGLFVAFMDMCSSRPD